MIEKTCADCGKSYPIEEFGKLKITLKNGELRLRSYCRKCWTDRCNNYAEKNRQKIREISRLSYLRNIEKTRERDRLRYYIHRIDTELKISGLMIPKKLSDCKGHPEPCPWVRCKHHLIWEVCPSIKKKSNKEILDFLFKMPVTCLFDLTNVDHTLQECADVFNVSREYIRQIEEKALRRIRNIKSRNAELIDYIDYENRHPIDPSIYANFDFNLTTEL